MTQNLGVSVRFGGSTFHFFLGGATCKLMAIPQMLLFLFNDPLGVVGVVSPTLVQIGCICSCVNVLVLSE